MEHLNQPTPQTSLELAGELEFERSLEADLCTRAIEAYASGKSESASYLMAIHEETQYKADETEAHIMDRGFDQALQSQMYRPTGPAPNADLAPMLRLIQNELTEKALQKDYWKEYADRNDYILDMPMQDKTL